MLGEVPKEGDGSLALESSATLPKDLRAIITQCVMEDPADRYSSASALLTDLQSYVNGYPVVARGADASYRLRKYVQRNKPMFMLGAASLLMLIAGVFTYTTNLRDAQRMAEDRADTTARLLRSMTELVGDTYSQLLGTRGERAGPSDGQLANEPLRLILERTNKIIASVAVEQPRLELELLHLQGSINRELFRTVESRDQLERALHIARDIDDGELEAKMLAELLHLATFAGAAEDGAKLVQLATAFAKNTTLSLEAQADLLRERAAFAMQQARFGEAISDAELAVELLESSTIDSPGLRAKAYIILGQCYGKLESYKQARVWMSKAAKILTETEGPLYRGLQAPISGLGWSHAVLGENLEAKAYFEQDLAIHKANYGLRYPGTAAALNNVGMMLNRLNDPVGAAAHFKQAIEILNNLGQSRYPLMAGLQSNLANVYKDTGEHNKALASYEAILDLQQAGATSPRDDAFLHNNYGDLLCTLGHVDRGHAQLRQAITKKLDVFGDDHISTARSMLLLAKSLIRHGQEAEAAQLIATATEIYRNFYGKTHQKLSLAQLIAAQHATVFGDVVQARELLEVALANRLDEYASDHIRVLPVYNAIVQTELKAGDATSAESWLAKLAPIMANASVQHPDVVEARILAAEVASRLGKGGGAEALAVKQLVRNSYPGRDDWSRRLSLF